MNSSGAKGAKLESFAHSFTDGMIDEPGADMENRLGWARHALADLARELGPAFAEIAKQGLGRG